MEEICFGTISEYDLSLCQDMILKSPTLKSGDILINDRGFLSREVMNKLDNEYYVFVTTDSFMARWNYQ
ncbi:MAG: hypothetical protein LBV68_01420 [Spirochaetaceae bacterium]|jgi:hypothetical protein|nr:hypothetical protein [Spirochaetaceae bacterium]